MQNPRRTACLALVRQENDGYSNLVLASALSKSGADAREKAFISALFYGTIERSITLDAILAQHLSKPLSKLDKEVRAVLRMGLYQALYMGSVPVSAAINEAVTLTRQMGKTSAAGFVNAVLRKASAFKAGDIKFKNELERLSFEYAVTKPIAQIYIDTFGESAEAELNAAFEKPELCVRVNTLKITLQDIVKRLEEKGIKAESAFVPGALCLTGCKDITSLDEFKQGFLHVQSAVSQYACYALSPQKGAMVLDLCAAPGGKSATLAQYMNNSGRLISADFAENRLSLINTLFERNGVSCAEIVHADARIYNENYLDADYVLCDVPCSGLGIISKKPDIRHKCLSEPGELISMQRQILDTASKYVKKGGKLVYSTCTVNKAENEDIVNSFLKSNPDFIAKTCPSPIPSAALCGKFALFTPLKTKTDGFFVATLERL